MMNKTQSLPLRISESRRENRVIIGCFMRVAGTIGKKNTASYKFREGQKGPIPEKALL